MFNFGGVLKISSNIGYPAIWQTVGTPEFGIYLVKGILAMNAVAS